MDKKLLLRESLAKIMFREKTQLDQIVKAHPDPEVTLKEDGSPVTKLDLALSTFVESLMTQYFPGVTFYSEENFKEWSFPLLALDPLDGTREYVDGRCEWALSIGLFHDQHFQGEGWVYNPKTSEYFSDTKLLPDPNKTQYVGEVSRSEWKSGLYTNKNSNLFSVNQKGSIAYKLGRLSAGKTDFVVSLRPKNIWDIAGGTLLCQKAGLKFYSQGVEVTKVNPKYEPPLIWCHEELFSGLSELYR